MIQRELLPVAKEALLGFPVVALVGPRQSGKTTLAKILGTDKPYSSLENPDTQEFARTDPRGYLAQFPNGAVLDEIQRCPELFSYLQGIVDEDGRMGLFILTGSQQFGLMGAITQSLAGRVALLTLLPFSLSEMQAGGIPPTTLDEMLWKGGYPPLYDRPVDPTSWLGSYVATYLERDVRMLTKVQDIATFQRFVQLCAGRVGQLVNISSLAADAGISRQTAEAWLSVMQASFLLFRLSPYFANTSKRLIKTPKLYFYDTGLAAWLLGIRDPSHLTSHPLRGNLFENWVMTELLKAQLHQGEPTRLYFWRDHDGSELDAVVEYGPRLAGIEVKSGQTFSTDFLKGFRAFEQKAARPLDTKWIVYGGITDSHRNGVHIAAWQTTNFATMVKLP